jgi:glycosyltransferase involved in cell wall biosynthesis
MNIAFVYAKGRVERYDKTLQGCAATEFFYGALELERLGHSITRYELGHGTTTKYWHKIAERLYRWRILPTRTNGTILAELYELCPLLNKHDVVVATTTASAFGLATLKLLGLVRRPIVAIHCGIVNYQLSWWRRKVNSIALKHMWTQLFGEGELTDIVNFYHVPDSRIEVNQFGVDTQFWTPGDNEGDYVLAVGNDERRDYELLVRVAAKIEEKVIILTRRKINADLPSNVEILKGGWHEEALTDEKLRDLYRNARLVVIPLIDSPQPSGQSVCLQAMACGKPVVLTQTEGLWSHTMMRSDENVLFVPPGNEKALLNVIKQLVSNSGQRKKIGRCARKTACVEGNISAFAGRLEALCHRVVAVEN